MASATGAGTTYAAAESDTNVCVFDVASAKPYRLVVRVEDSFSSIDSVASVFTDGREVDLGASQGWWAPAVTTLWVPAQSDGLYAVQFLNLAAGDSDAEQMAAAIGMLLTTR
jgi:hypothetical protein